MRCQSASAVLLSLILAGSATFANAQSSSATAVALRAQDYIDIQQLYARYALLIDTGDAEGWANTFTPDGVFNNSSKGHDALVQFVHDWRDRGDRVDLHAVARHQHKGAVTNRELPLRGCPREDSGRLAVHDPGAAPRYAACQSVDH